MVFFIYVKSLQSRKVPPFLFRGNDEKRSDELGNVFSPKPHREEAVNLVSLSWSKQVVLCPGCIERKTRCKVLREKMSPYQPQTKKKQTAPAKNQHKQQTSSQECTGCNTLCTWEWLLTQNPNPTKRHNFLFCTAADLAQGVVGQKISYLLKRQCNNCKRPGYQGATKQGNNTPQHKTKTKPAKQTW